MKTDAIIPTYDLKQCAGFKDFIISNNQCDEADFHSLEPHRHASYTIDILVRGELTMYLDFEKFQVKAPAVILISPDQVHLHDSKSDYEIISISFNKDYLVNEVENMLMCWECMFGAGAIHLEKDQLDELFIYARLMFEEFRGNRIQKDIVIRNLLATFIICCMRLLRKTAATPKLDTAQNNMVRAFRELVDKNYHEKTQVAHYAEMLYVTPGHLNDTIKSLTGRTAKQLIDAKRITEAKRLLYWGRHSVKEIAWQLNFEDDAYFNRYFKKHTGHTPALYQKSILNKYN